MYAVQKKNLRKVVHFDGGHNGLVDVDELVAAQGGGEAAAPKAAVKFQTWSMVGAQNKWADNFSKEESAGVGVKSYWKFGGNVTPHVPVYVEVALFENDSFDNLYNSDSTDVAKNALNMLVDTVFDPIYYFGGQAESKTYLGHFKSGLETPWVNWTTGYKYAKLPPHTNVNWVTLDKEWEAGYNSVGGYNQFELGSAAKEAISSLTDGLVQAEVVLGPNRSADRAGSQYGFYGYVDATIAGTQYVDFQYNGAYGKTFDKIFDSIMEDDFILGYKGIFGPATVKANFLYNMYGSTLNADGTKSYYSPSTSDVGRVKDVPESVLDNMAANVNVTFSNDLLTAKAGARIRGAQANMMYVEDGADDHTNIKDQLGKTNRLRGFAGADVNVIEDMLTLGVSAYYEQYLREDAVASKYKWNNAKNKQIYASPSFTFNLEDVLYIDAKVEGYAEMLFNTAEEDKIVSAGLDASPFAFTVGGLKYSMNFEDSIFSDLAVTYCYDGNDEDCALHSLIAEFNGLPFGINAQLGGGFRTVGGFTPYTYTSDGKTVNGAFGAFVGANKVINNKYKTLLYGQFCYGMNPYNDFGDGQEAFKLDGYTIDRDANDFAGAAAATVGVRFEL